MEINSFFLLNVFLSMYVNILSGGKLVVNRCTKPEIWVSVSIHVFFKHVHTFYVIHTEVVNKSKSIFTLCIDASY